MVHSLHGDAAVYRQLRTGCPLWLSRYFARRMAPSQIDDLIQSTLVAVHTKRATYDPDHAFLPWLAAAGFGTITCSLHCPSNSVFYIGLFYGLAVALCAAVGRLIVPRTIKW